MFVIMPIATSESAANHGIRFSERIHATVQAERGYQTEWYYHKDRCDAHWLFVLGRMDVWKWNIFQPYRFLGTPLDREEF